VAVLTLCAESAGAFSGDQIRLIQMVAPHRRSRSALRHRLAGDLPAALPKKPVPGGVTPIVGRRVSDSLPAVQDTLTKSIIALAAAVNYVSLHRKVSCYWFPPVTPLPDTECPGRCKRS
jgi:hypothetical protein